MPSHVAAEIELYGDLKTFYDPFLTIPRDYFIWGETIYFLATVGSDQADIIGTRIIQVDVQTLHLVTTITTCIMNEINFNRFFCNVIFLKVSISIEHWKRILQMTAPPKFSKSDFLFIGLVFLHRSVVICDRQKIHTVLQKS